MRLKCLFGFMLCAFTVMAACAPKTTAPPSSTPSEPSWHWERAGDKSGVSPEQFSRDRYACLQDYRQTASPFIQRDSVTELEMMKLHQVVCLEGKGWKRVDDRPAVVDQAQSYWRPSGWFVAGDGMKGAWFWKGKPLEETSADWNHDNEECRHDAEILKSEAKAVPRDKMEKWFACMWERNWSREPVPKEKRSGKVEGRSAESKGRVYWRPGGYVTAPPDTKAIDWVWQGPPDEEITAVKRFRPEKEACMRDSGILDPQTFTNEQGEAFMACMWGKKWGQEPTSTR